MNSDNKSVCAEVFQDDASARRRFLQAGAALGLAAFAFSQAGDASAAPAADQGVKPVPPPAPIKATEGLVEVGDGHSLWYFDTGGDGVPVIFLHAGTGSGLVWLYQTPIFAKAGYQGEGGREAEREIVEELHRAASEAEPGAESRDRQPEQRDEGEHAYIPEAAAKLAPNHKDAKGDWNAVLVHYLVPAVNTELVKPADEPKSLEDLLDPKWKGKIAWTGEMTIAGPPGFIGSVLNAYGEEKGMAYLEKLGAQKIATVPSNSRVVLDQVIAGQYAIGLVTYNHHSAISIAKGAPVKWLPVNPAIGAMAREVLLKGGPHPNGAKLLINYLLSPEGQKVIQEAGYIPSNPAVDAKEPSLKPEISGFKVFSPTPADEDRDIDRWIAIYKKLFQ